MQTAMFELMTKISRREAREILLGLLFETEFRSDEDVNGVFALAIEDRELPDDEYISRGYFGIYDNIEEIDGVIGKHSNGWKPERMSKLSRSVLRLCVYEMLYEEGIPYSVSINEAVELTKKFDDDKARPFVNGILNSVKNELEAK
ncbi:MAG: transcription antitermination factor NusB [Clostridia bacterium]|nr:transcription antitermination factor NusB [Clostridia bacterium]MBR4013635.1 transcription antitermination factor NusB [Clostridia bacterium]